MKTTMPCPFCQVGYSATDLVLHCRQCKSRKRSKKDAAPVEAAPVDAAPIEPVPEESPVKVE